MRNVAPSRALARRARGLLQLAFVVGSAGIFLATVGIALFVVPLTSTSSDTYRIYDISRNVLFIAGTIGIIAAVFVAIRAITLKTENDLAFRVGQELANYFDERYTFIRNVNKRGLGYMDAILVGLPGALVFRILDYEGEFLNEAGKWLRRDKHGDWVVMLTNPTQQVVDDIKTLRDYLAQRGLPDIPVYGVIVFTNDDPTARLTVKDPVVPPTHMTSLINRLQANYLAKERIDRQTAVALVKLLYDQ